MGEGAIKRLKVSYWGWRGLLGSDWLVLLLGLMGQSERGNTWGFFIEGWTYL